MARYDLEHAVHIAEGFLKGRHNTMNLESSNLKTDIWRIVFDVGFLNRHLKEIQVDANSGKIVRYVNVDVTD